jgi:murein DD-endopeptidase MepM/ murein hydrolase activator NlpD
MDTAGTCVIIATPFENEDVAAKILTDPIKPIQSQFSPSYSLCINLIERGQGRLVVARQLVSRSFDVWQRSRIISLQSNASTETTRKSSRGPMDELSRTLQEAKIIELIGQTLKSIITQRSAMFDVRRVESVMKVMNDRDSIKAASKAFVALERRLELEKQTLLYLELENDQTSSSSAAASSQTVLEPNPELETDSQSLQQMLKEDKDSIRSLIQQQRSRVNSIESDMNRHPFTFVSSIINQVMDSSRNNDQNMQLTLALANVRNDIDSNKSFTPITPTELSSFSKSFVTADRMARKAAKKQTDNNVEGISKDDESNHKQLSGSEFVDDDSWNDFVSITKVLVAYGCLVSETKTTKWDISEIDSDRPLTDDTMFTVTPAGANVGMLGLENSLWILVALGGASDTINVPSKNRYDYSSTNNDSYGSNDEQSDTNALLQRQELVEALRTMSPSEIAGYTSCIISEDSRSSFGLSVVDQFQQLSFAQQEATQKLMFVMDRFKEIQSMFGVGNRSGNCNM